MCANRVEDTPFERRPVELVVLDLTLGLRQFENINSSASRSRRRTCCSDPYVPKLSYHAGRLHAPFYQARAAKIAKPSGVRSSSPLVVFGQRASWEWLRVDCVLRRRSGASRLVVLAFTL